MDGRDVLHRESQRMPGWARIILWGSAAVFVYLLWSAGSRGEMGRAAAFLGAAVVLLVPSLVEWGIGVLLVTVDHEGVEARMGRTGLLRKRFPWSDVEAAEAVRYHPLREFGGWGIRWSWSDWKKRAWTQSGDGAVVLHLQGGVRFYLGSDRPERLLERMRAAAGRGLDPRG